jgi:hypothetical protein
MNRAEGSFVAACVDLRCRQMVAEFLSSFRLQSSRERELVHLANAFPGPSGSFPTLY